MKIAPVKIERKKTDVGSTDADYKLFDHVPVGLFRAALDGKILEANSAAALMCGFSTREAILGKNWLAMFEAPSEREKVAASIEHAAEIRDCEVQLRRRDGSLIWCRASLHVVRDARGNALFCEGAMEDVTERRIATEALMESEVRFRKLSDATPLMIWMTDEHDQATYFNKGWLDYRGRTLAQEIAGGWKDGIHPADFERGSLEYSAALSTRVETRIEFRLKRFDGVYRWILGTGSPRFSPDGKYLGFVGSCTDITSLKEVEDALKRRSNQLEILTQASQQVNAILEVSAIMRTLVASAMRLVNAESGTAGLIENGKMVYREYNYNGNVSPITLVYEAGVGVPGWVIVHKKPYLCRDAASDPIVSEARTKLGLRDFVDVPILNRKGEVIGCFGIHNSIGGSGFTEQDLSLLEGLAASAAIALENAQSLDERRQAVEALRESEERFRIMADSSPVIMWVTDADGQLRFVNRTYREFFGLEYEEIEGSKWLPLIHPEEIQEYEEMFFRSVKQQTPFAKEARVRHADGQWRWVASYAAPRFSHNQEFQGHVGISLDLTERKLLEDQFRQAQKMEAVGRLAGGVAHDFNNLLTVIIGNVDLVELKLHREDPLLEPLALIRSMVDRGAGLTRQLLAFSRRQPQQPRAINLNHIIADMEKMSRRLIGENIKLLTRTAQVLPNIKADPGQIEQVIMNLVVNARDAMPDGGTLSIETAVAELEEDYTATHPEVVPGRYCVLMVSDTGFGMSDHVLEHAFEPFFTTKPVGQGTGLGLSTVHGIVKQSGGHIWLYSEAGMGTSFKIYLPAVHDALDEVPEAKRVVDIPRGSETILLVEDESAIREMAVAILRMQGYDVLVAESGGDALLESERCPGGIDMLLTDVVMPRLSGTELASRLREKMPDLKVLYMSGYPDSMIGEVGAIDASAPFIQKPFRPADLARKVREVLDLRK